MTTNAAPGYFAVQVASRCEARLLRTAAMTLERFGGVRLLWPRRTLRIRREGVWRERQQPVFPGYLFLEAHGVDGDLYRAVRELPGFVRFLPSNQNVQAITERDARALAHLLRFGEVVRKSIVAFDEDSRIRIIDGPLKGLEGLIVKVDRRKNRAKVKLHLYDETHLVDFGFTALERNTGEDRAPH
jgi:transcription termination/antitermination protein NusG